MSRRWKLNQTVAGVLTAGFLLTLLPPALAQPKMPEWSHALDLRVRPPGKDLGWEKAKGFGLEVFRDANNGQGLYITEVGDVTAVGGFKGAKVPAPSGRKPTWMHGIELNVRPAGTVEWAKAKPFSIEVFRDEVNGNWIYLNHRGNLSVVPGASGAKAPTDPVKTPVWLHGFDLKARKYGDKIFDKNTKAWSIEVFRDESNGNLIYICESGFMAVVPGFDKLPSPTPKPKDAEHLHGLDLKVRKGGSKDFGTGNKLYGVEAFRDENTGNLIYLTETGSLTVVPGKQNLAVPTKDPSEPKFTHGLDLKCRRFGDKDWDKNTPLFGIETFNDDNTGCTIYIIETGAIAAAPKQ
jgi:hypothetical protein